MDLYLIIILAVSTLEKIQVMELKNKNASGKLVNKGAAARSTRPPEDMPINKLRTLLRENPTICDYVNLFEFVHQNHPVLSHAVHMYRQTLNMLLKENRKQKSAALITFGKTRSSRVSNMRIIVNHRVLQDFFDAFCKEKWWLHNNTITSSRLKNLFLSGTSNVGKTTLRILMMEFFNLMIIPKDSHFFDSYDVNSKYDVILLDEFIWKILGEMGFTAVSMIKELTDLMQPFLIRKKFGLEYFITEWHPVIILAQQPPSETFSKSCSNGSFWKNNAELAQEDLKAITNRFVCVHLDGKNGWRDPHSGQVVHRLEWIFEDFDSARRITSDDVYNMNSDYQKERRKRIFGDDDDLIRKENNNSTENNNDLHHHLNTAHEEQVIEVSAIRKAEYDHDIYSHTIGSEMVDEYDEEKGYQFLKDKYPEFDDRLARRDVGRRRDCYASDVKVLMTPQRTTIDIEKENEELSDIISGDGKEDPDDEGDQDGDKIIFRDIDAELTYLEENLGVHPEGPSRMKSIPSAEYLGDMLACEDEVARMLYIFLHCYRFDRYESSTQGRDEFYRLASGGGIKVENFIWDLVSPLIEEDFRDALENFCCFHLHWL